MGQYVNGIATYYFAGGSYEVTVDANNNETTKTYYSLGGQMVAMDDGSGLQYFLTDHLGSIAAVVSANGTLLGEQRYLPFGEPRALTGSPLLTQTDFGYTGQRELENTGLMDYRARFYDPCWADSFNRIRLSRTRSIRRPGTVTATD